MKKKKIPQWDINDFVSGNIGTIPVKDCQANWICCKTAIPAFSKKHLLIVNEKGGVIAGSFDGELQLFKARVNANSFRWFKAMAWRLFPESPCKETNPDAVLTVRFLNSLSNDTGQ